MTVEFASRTGRQVNARVIAFNEALRARGIKGVIETVPTFRSVIVHYDPLVLSHVELCSALDTLEVAPEQETGSGRLITLPVAYGGAHGPDLRDVAAAGGLSEDEAIARHSEVTHYVYMIGFAPGHPYMGDLPAALTLPRRKTPRTRIAPGTVAIAVGQTVIYPFPSPGGWHAIGRTPVALFDIARDEPALLRAGDRVRLRPISETEFDTLASRPLAQPITIEGPAS